MKVWDIVFVVATIFGGLVGGLVAALTFAQARRYRNQPFSNVAAVGVFLISALVSITAVLFFWWYFDLGPINWPIFILGNSQSDIDNPIRLGPGLCLFFRDGFTELNTDSADSERS